MRGSARTRGPGRRAEGGGLRADLLREGIGQVDQRPAGVRQAHEGPCDGRYRRGDQTGPPGALEPRPVQRGFVSLGEGWCDTTSDVGQLMLTIMGGIAQFERALIRKRCGIERAKARGTQFGRPSRLDAGQRRKIAERYAAGETMAELALEYEVGEATIWRAFQPETKEAA